jgi:hypothetical protein
VPLITVIFGVLLTLLGLVLYRMSESGAPTALIPSVFGVVLVLCGQIARGNSAKARMHAMHAAAVVGVIGLAGGAVMTVVDLQKLASDEPVLYKALGGKAALAMLCAVFVALCVKSFIDARRARKRAENSPAASG